MVLLEKNMFSSEIFEFLDKCCFYFEHFDFLFYQLSMDPFWKHAQWWIRYICSKMIMKILLDLFKSMLKPSYFLILTHSNMSVWSFFFNPEIPNSIIFLHGIYYIVNSVVFDSFDLLKKKFNRRRFLEIFFWGEWFLFYQN